MKNTQVSTSVGILIIILVFILITVAISISTLFEGGANNTQEKVFPYRVIEERDISYAGCKRVGIKIVVPDTSVRTDIDQTMNQIINSKKSAWDDITVWAYRLSEEGIALVSAHTMGMKEYSVCN